MVHEQFEETGDITKGLLPIFTPLLRDKEGELFQITSFCSDINKEYGLEIHPYVIEDMIPSLVTTGVLEEKESFNNGCTYYIKKVHCEQDINIEETLVKVGKTFKNMSLTILNNVGIASQEIDFYAEFSRRLARTNYNVDSGLEVDNYKDKKVSTNIDSILDYCFARYMSDLIEKEAPELDVLKQAYSGAILSEVILSLRDPGITNGNIEGKYFYLDAPILLNLLGFNSDYSVDCSKNLIKQILSNGGIITTSDTYIKEAKASISWAIRNFENKGSRTSNLCRYMFKNPGAISEVRYAQTSIEKMLIAIGFSLDTGLTNLSGRLISQRATSLCAKVAELLNWYKNDEGPLHDAEMITYVVQHHGYCSIKSISDSKSFFITNNERQVSVVNKYLYSEGLFQKPEITPILSERNIAVIMWVIAGGKGIDVSSLTLISNCTRAMDMNKEVFLNFSHFLNKLPDDKKAIYEDIMANDRAIYCLMDEVGGNFDSINENNSEKILGHSYEQLKKNIEIEALSSQAELSSENQQLKDNLSVAENKLTKALSTIKQKSKIGLELADEIHELKINKSVTDENLIIEDTQKVKVKVVDSENNTENSKLLKYENLAHNTSTAVEKILIFLSTLVYCFIVFKLTQVSIDTAYENEYIMIKKPLLEYMSYLIIILTFWKSPNFILQKPISNLKGKVYKLISPYS